MPIYMDFHHFPEGINLEEIMQAHMSELAVQNEYGIRYLQYWVNSREGYIYCLMESPDPESCEKLHHAVDHDLACNIQEVDQDKLHAFMGMNIPHNNHLALTPSGEVDKAHRGILMVNLRTLNSQYPYEIEPGAITVSYQPKSIGLLLIGRHNGRLYEHDEVDNLIAVFNTSSDAVNCAFEIQREFLEKIHNSTRAAWNIEFRISVTHDQPLKATGGFFESSLKDLERFVLIAEPDSIVFSSNLKKQVYELQTFDTVNKYRIFSPDEESFIQQMFAALQVHACSELFGVEELARHMNCSRSTLYRRTLAVLGISPIKLISTYRLQTARHLIGKNVMNINQVAFEVGFSNPSYFTKLFKEAYGLLPSQVAIGLN